MMDLTVAERRISSGQFIRWSERNDYADRGLGQADERRDEGALQSGARAGSRDKAAGHGIMGIIL